MERYPYQKGAYEASFESLQTYACPDWFRDAKFGVWSHWGPQSVPMYGDWYARRMYVEGSDQYRYHLRHYGHPSRFGYKDLAALWKAENFDPDGLMARYKAAGARYFMGQCMHHDHFFNYPSRVNAFNSANVGPHKDICGLWKAAADKQGLRFGLSEHLGATYVWWSTNKGADVQGPYAGVPYDGSDPANADIYLRNREHYRPLPEGEAAQPWYTQNEDWHRYWHSAITEVIDRYAPDLLYSDGPLPFGARGESQPGDAAFSAGLSAVAHLYNASCARNGSNQAVYLQKDRRPQIYSVGVLDIEKSQLPGIAEQPWHTDTCIGNWFYDVRQVYKKGHHVAEMLVDIIAKNGCMLLNILQKPDGSIDEEAAFLLKQLTVWFAANGEGVYGTRPFRVFGEGPSQVAIQGYKEDAVPWTDADIRFTAKGKAVYAFLMRAPQNGVAVIKSLLPTQRVAAVSLLGHGPVPFVQAFGPVSAQLPSALPAPFVPCLKIELE